MTTGHHEELRRDETIELGSDRSFGCVFVAVFVVIALWPLWGGLMPRWWALAVAAAFLVPAIAVPRLLRPLNRLWHRFGLGLARVVSPIVLGLLFYLVVTPIGLVMRLAGKDPLRLQRDPKADTYWIERNPPGPKPDSMKNQF